MNKEIVANDHFTNVLDDDEKVILHTRPKFLPFLATGIPFLIIGLIWGALDLSFFTSFNSFSNERTAINKEFGTATKLFFLLHSAPAWLSILNIFRLILVFKNTSYAITNKRAILRSGFFGIDFKSIDYDKMQDVQVTVNPLENLFKVGSIKINSGSTTNKGSVIYDSMTAITEPYEVYKKLKTISTDVKTDWNYPNKLRPDENPGYNTEYKPKES